MAKDWRAAYRCPVGKGGRVKAEAAKSGTCFVIERVKRNGRKGFTTRLHNRASGRPVGYAGPSETGKACPTTQDPFRAAIRPKGAAVSTGAACARKMSVAKKIVTRPKKRRVVKKSRKKLKKAS